MAGNPRIDDLRKRLEKDPGSRLFAQLAEELRKDGDLEDAIRVAREGLQKHPNYPSARMTLGRALPRHRGLGGGPRGVRAGPQGRARQHPGQPVPGGVPGGAGRRGGRDGALQGDPRPGARRQTRAGPPGGAGVAAAGAAAPAAAPPARARPGSLRVAGRTGAGTRRRPAPDTARGRGCADGARAAGGPRASCLRPSQRRPRPRRRAPPGIRGRARAAAHPGHRRAGGVRAGAALRSARPVDGLAPRPALRPPPRRWPAPRPCGGAHDAVRFRGAGPRHAAGPHVADPGRAVLQPGLHRQGDRGLPPAPRARAGQRARPHGGA